MADHHGSHPLAVPGNKASKQRKKQHDHSQRLFPSLVQTGEDLILDEKLQSCGKRERRRRRRERGRSLSACSSTSSESSQSDSSSYSSECTCSCCNSCFSASSTGSTRKKQRSKYTTLQKIPEEELVVSMCEARGRGNRNRKRNEDDAPPPSTIVSGVSIIINILFYWNLLGVVCSKGRSQIT